MSELTDKIHAFGHCMKCGDNLLIKRVVDGRVVDMFLPTYDEAIFLLNNGSQMQITICRKCKESVDLNDPKVHTEIMSAVYKGWELETKQAVERKSPGWTEEKRDQYLKNQSELSINCNSENLDRYAIQQKQVELLKMSVSDVEVK